MASSLVARLAATRQLAVTAQHCRVFHAAAPLLEPANKMKNDDHSVSAPTSRTEEKAQPQMTKEDMSMHELMRNFLDPKDFHAALGNVGIDFFTGVPDSLLKDFCAYVTGNSAANKHIIAANEGSAVAIAAGYHMATKKVPLVYLQNSGIGNIVNPIMSLAHPDVYSIPMLVLIGWRGEPGKYDEPQHLTQGETTPALIASMGLPFQVLPDYIEGAEKVLSTAKKHMEVSKGPYCLLVKRQTFLKYNLPSVKVDRPHNRESALKVVVDNLHTKDVVIGTTGMLSRELFEYRVALGHSHERDFLTVGCMGHASAIALGIATAKPHRRVVCLDGDGAVLMHMGTMSTIGSSNCDNLKHIVFDNNAHDSVGGQPTVSAHMDTTAIATAVGYKAVWNATTTEEIAAAVKEMLATPGPCMVRVHIRPRGVRSDLGRPTRSPKENLSDFMQFLDRV